MGLRAQLHDGASQQDLPCREELEQVSWEATGVGFPASWPETATFPRGVGVHVAVAVPGAVLGAELGLQERRCSRKAEEVPCPGTGLSRGARAGGTAQIPECLHSIRRQAAPRSQTGATVRGKDEPGGGRGAGWILPQTGVS